MVLDVLHLGLDRILFQSELPQKGRDGFVACPDICRHRPPGFGQGKTAISLIIDVAPFREAPDHIGNRRATQFQGFRHVADARIAEAIHQILNPFEVILDGFGAIGPALGSHVRADGSAQRCDFTMPGGALFVGVRDAEQGFLAKGFAEQLQSKREPG